MGFADTAALDWLFMYAAVVPLVVILLWTLVRQPPDAHKAHVTALGLAISLLLTALITDIIKNFVGRPRPDLVSRCDPQPGTLKDELVTIAICTETEHHKLHDGWRSFPSGHSSFSFAGLGWLALFFASQTHCVRARGSLILVLLCLTPLMGAALVAVSRLEDYRHDVGDVMVGAVIGCLVTYLNWRRYYPSLLSKWCDEPYDPPGSKNGYQKAARDEEEMVGIEGEEGNGGGGSRSGSR
jgi:diacylglycerol diphosphate phosphatase/phosphatidate phosphatase